MPAAKGSAHTSLGPKNENEGSLTKQLMHEDKKCPCKSCDYQATTRGSLAKHKQSINEGKTYPCDSCEKSLYIVVSEIEYI